MLTDSIVWHTMRLFVDKSCRDTNSEAILTTTPTQILSGSFGENPRHQVSVFAKTGWLSPKVKICVDGDPIAGDF
jgi:hypothetical protein